MKVARNHIIAAIEAGRRIYFPKYAIQAYPSVAVPGSPQFGWHIVVTPGEKSK
jgi:hypothetical protein